MEENSDYIKNLTDALHGRAEWLDKTELPKLKDELRAFHTGYASLYNIYLKKGLINEDPYKQEAKIGELKVPDSSSFNEGEKLEKLTQRLANFDTQLDFLVNFYSFGVEFLDLDQIKRILGLVKYIDWVHLTPDSQNIMTKSLAEMTNSIKIGADSMTMSVISESLANLNRSYNPILSCLKNLTDYRKEVYKLDLREITAGMPQADLVNLPQLKKKFAQAKPGVPFYPDLVDEVIKEDTAKEGPALREAVLKKLEIAENKPKATKEKVSFKSILIEGIQTLGSTAVTFTEIAAKLDANHEILANRKQGFMEKVKKMIQMMFNKEPDAVIYEVEYMDPVKGISVREKVNYNSFRTDIDRKIRTLTPLVSRGTAVTKLESMQEEQLTGFLERNVRELQTMHKILSALDDFFKAEVDRADRERIKGIKPELGTMKNAILKANSKRHEYSAQKEEEEQLKRLGVNPVFG